MFQKPFQRYSLTVSQRQVHMPTWIPMALQMRTSSSHCTNKIQRGENGPYVIPPALGKVWHVKLKCVLKKLENNTLDVAQNGTAKNEGLKLSDFWSIQNIHLNKPAKSMSNHKDIHFLEDVGPGIARGMIAVIKIAALRIGFLLRRNA